VVICISGGIASGKTLATKFIKEQNPDWILFSADAYVEEIYKKDNIGYKKIKKFLGKEFVDDKGVLKGKILELSIKNPNFIKKIEEIIWPLIYDKITELIKLYDNTNLIIELAIFLKVPQLFNKLFDRIIIVKRKKDIRIKEISKRYSISLTESASRMSLYDNFDISSISGLKNIFILENNSSKKHFRLKINELIKR